MKGPSKLSVSDRHNLKGLLFLLPFLIGFIFFYIEPIVQSISFSFNEVKVDLGGFVQKFIGFENYNYIFRKDDSFVDTLIADFLNLLWKTPVITVLSLFFAILLNQKFRGRVFFRAVFFLPVIFSAGVVLGILQSDMVVQSAIESSSLSASTSVNQATSISTLLTQAGLPDKIVDLIMTITNSFFSLIWSTGIQMLIFLAGLQSISPSLYEAASVEGASGWEAFCKITVPLISPMIILNLVYTVVDSYTASNNGVLGLITNNISNNRFGQSSAMSWTYFLFIALILGVIFLIFNAATSDKKKKKREEF